jgi:hypothetical protein
VVVISGTHIEQSVDRDQYVTTIIDVKIIYDEQNIVKVKEKITNEFVKIYKEVAGLWQEGKPVITPMSFINEFLYPHKVFFHFVIFVYGRILYVTFRPINRTGWNNDYYE